MINPSKNTSTDYVEIEEDGAVVVKGRMISSSITESSGFYREDEIKKELLNLLLQELVEERCIEFTKQIDGDSMATCFRARIFVTPDDTIRTLRTWKKK